MAGEDFREQFGLRLAGARERAGLTQDALGARLGLTAAARRGTVSAWENRRGLPDAQRLRELCDALGCSADSLLWSEEEAAQDRSAIAADLLHRLALAPPHVRQAVGHQIAAMLALAQA